MTIYETALIHGLTVNFNVTDGAFEAAVSLRGDEAIYTGRGDTLDAAVLAAIFAMDDANNERA